MGHLTDGVLFSASAAAIQNTNVYEHLPSGWCKEPRDGGVTQTDVRGCKLYECRCYRLSEPWRTLDNVSRSRYGKVKVPLLWLYDFTNGSLIGSIWLVQSSSSLSVFFISLLSSSITDYSCGCVTCFMHSGCRLGLWRGGHFHIAHGKKMLFLLIFLSCFQISKHS